LVRAEIAKPNTTIGKSHSCGDKCCKCCRHMYHRILVRSPENSTNYFVLLIARVQILFTFLSVPCVASNTLASLRSPSTNVWMDTGVTLPKGHFFLWASTSDCLNTVSRILTEIEIEQNCLWSDFQRGKRERFWIKELVFYIRTALAENNRFLCIFSFTMFIVNEYFTTVTKLSIG
jgi:hypothetical protein